MRVYVARHGETTWNVAGRYQGRLESELSARGRRQAAALADVFANGGPTLSRIVSSPLGRCRATAEAVARRLDLALETDERLVEIAHGTWEGRLRDEIAANDPERFQSWRQRPASVAFEAGESLLHVQARWHDFATTLSAPGNVLVVTHDVVVRIALLAATKRTLDDLWRVQVENAAFAEFEVDAGDWQLINENLNGHLTGLHAATEGQAL